LDENGSSEDTRVISRRFEGIGTSFYITSPTGETARITHEGNGGARLRQAREAAEHAPVNTQSFC